MVLYGRCDEDLGIPYQPWIEALTGLRSCTRREPVLAAHVDGSGRSITRRLVPEPGPTRAVELRRRADDCGHGAVRAVRLRRSTCSQVAARVPGGGRRARRSALGRPRQRPAAPPRRRRPTRRCGSASSEPSATRISRPTTRSTDLLGALHRENRGGADRAAGPRRRRRDSTCWRPSPATRWTSRVPPCATRCWPRRRGNPFFVAEILRHLAETGAIYQQDDGRWVADSDLPVGLGLR